MAKGSTYRPECWTYKDSEFLAPIRQVTSAPTVHHHPFSYVPAYDDAMRRLIFVSHRTGKPQVFFEIQESGKIIQVTDRDDLIEWSLHPSHDGRYVYFMAGSGAWRADLETLEEEQLADFGDIELREKGMPGEALDTTALSEDDQWWAIPVRSGGMSRLVIIDTSSGAQETILERDTIGHPEFHPEDPTLLRYTGPYSDRIWVINRDGSENRLVYKRNAKKKEWIVHETWLRGTREIVAANWPNGVFAVNVDTGETRHVTSARAWHPVSNRDGSLLIADTNVPDTGIQLFSPHDGTGEPRTLCRTESSNQGAHWRSTHCPHDDGPVKVMALEHTHPHPSFSPDGRKVVFTSDRTGHPQIYEVEIPEEAL